MQRAPAERAGLFKMTINLAIECRAKRDFHVCHFAKVTAVSIFRKHFLSLGHDCQIDGLIPPPTAI
jgi:hypothetical protein